MNSKKIKDFKGILEEANIEIVEDDEKEELKKMLKSSGENRIVLAKLFLKCYNIFDNILIQINNDSLSKYLDYFDVEDLRILIEQYGDGGEGTRFKEYDIQDYVNLNRKEMKNLIEKLFIIIGDGVSE